MFILLDETGKAITLRESLNRMGIHIRETKQTNEPNREARRKLKRGGK